MSSRLRIPLAVTVLTLCAAAAYYWFSDQRSTGAATDEVTAAALDPATAIPSDRVELPPEKLLSADLSFSDVTTTSLRLETVVPGRLQYDERRHVEIRSATSGIITDIRVKPGDSVLAGDVLIVLNSSDVGNARADVLQRTATLKLARDKRDWQKATCSGLAKLAEAIRGRVPVENIRHQFREVILGKSREQLLSAYSDLLLAESLADAAQKNAKSGVVPGRVVEERLTTRDNSEAALTSALEELTFEATQSCRQAEAEAEDAQRRLKISLQSVRTLLGNTTAEDPTEPLHSAADGSAQPDAVLDEVLSLVRLLAPFGGTIERRQLSASERVDGGSAILTLADTSTLWVAADLREREWSALDLKQGDRVQVSTPVPGIETLTATIHFLGREVDPRTNAVPLIAVIDNADGRLRPGMSVRVTVPLSAARDVLAVREAAVLQHQGHSFVFTTDGSSEFRRAEIVPGMNSGGMIEVVSGLQQGQKVVSGGAFYLKSELLLQGEDK